MITWFFDILVKLANTAWSVFGAALNFLWRLFSSGVDLLLRGARALANLLFHPLKLWDGAWDRVCSWDLGGTFMAVLAMLLIACVVLALVAVGENLYRRWRGR